MDKKYYYRMLGITRSNPTQQQIREAYDQRMAKLNSSDYEDDRQYRHPPDRERRGITFPLPCLKKSGIMIIIG